MSRHGQHGGAAARPNPPRRRRLALGAAAALLLLLAGAVWLLPGVMDWGRYRDTIAALAAQRLGRPVHIGGNVSLALLPQPILTAADVVVEDAGDGIGLKAKALRLRVGLGALLAGRLNTRELTLQGADLSLPWPPAPGAMARRPPAWATSLRARIEDGRLQVGTVAFTNIEANLATDQDTGSLAAAGVGQSGGRTWQFTARLAHPGRDGSAGLDVSLDGQGPLRDTGGTFSGQIGANGALAGRVAGRGPDLSLLLPAPPVPWRGDGRLSAAGGLAVADELALEIGGAPARGAVALRVSPAARLDLAIAAGRLDLDAWLPALLAGITGPNAGVRAGIPTGVDLSAEAATLAGGTLRRLRGALDLGPGTLLLRDVEAVLPGDARLALSGQVAAPPDPPPGPAPATPTPQSPGNNPPPNAPPAATVPSPAPPARRRFEGAVRVTAPDLRATLQWLQPLLPPALAAVPPGALRTAELSGRILAQPGLLQVDDLAGTLDNAKLGGSASFRPAARPGARPGITANIALDRLAIADWLPRQAITPLLASPGLLVAALDTLRAADLDLRLRAAQADWGATALGTVAVELQAEPSRVFLRRLEAQPEGARLSLSGQVSAAGRLSDGRLELAAPDLRTLRPLLAEAPSPIIPRLDPLLRGPGSALLTFAGPPEALALRLVAEATDLRLEAQPVLNAPARRWAGPLLLHHPGAPRLMETLGLPGAAAWLGDGSFSLLGQASWAPGRQEMDGMTLAAGALRANLRLVLDGKGLTGAIVAETLPIPLTDLHSPDPLPLDWLRDGRAALHVEAAEVLNGLSPTLGGVSADLMLDAGVLRVSKLSGRAAGGSFAGAATVDVAAETPRVSLEGQATGLSATGGVFGTPLDLSAGLFDVTAVFSAAGHSPAALLATLDGRAFVRGANGAATGFDMAAAGAALTMPDPAAASAAGVGALTGGITPFTGLEGTFSLSRGQVSANMTLASPAGTAQATGGLDLPNAGLDLRVVLRPRLPNPPALAVRFNGPAAAPAVTPELAGLALWLAERP